MRYLIDTNILSYLDDRNSVFHRKVKERFSFLSDNDEVFISVLTIYELEYSVSLAAPNKAERLRKLVNSFRKHFPVVSITDKGAKAFGELKSKYRKDTGNKQKSLDQHNIDFMIASSALSEGLILVSNDSIFQRIQSLAPDLKTENWAI